MLFCFFTIACSSEKNRNNSDNKNSAITIPKVEKEISCKCFDGIGSRNGDTANIVMNFSNGESISLCGFVDKEMEEMIFSEFNIFECKTGKSLTQFDATQNCRIIEKKDTLIIKELEYLPIGKNWTWEFIQIGEQIITTRDNKIFASKLSPKLEKFTIDDNDKKIFLNSLRKGTGHSKEWELEIGKLESLSLLGNEKAKNILENYEKFTGQGTDGAVAETWKDAKATVDWLKK